MAKTQRERKMEREREKEGDIYRRERERVLRERMREREGERDRERGMPLPLAKLLSQKIEALRFFTMGAVVALARHPPSLRLSGSFNSFLLFGKSK